MRKVIVESMKITILYIIIFRYLMSFDAIKEIHIHSVISSMNQLTEAVGRVSNAIEENCAIKHFEN